MQQVKLYINDTLVDLPSDIARQLRVSKGGTDVADIEARSADTSYTLVLPFTRINHALFRAKGNPQVFGKFYAPSPYRARLEVGERLILDGTFRLSGIKSGYEGRITSDEVDVFSLIAEKTLRDITTFQPWQYRGRDSFPEILSVTNATSDVCMPLVAYGNFYAFEGFPLALNTPAPDVPPSNKIIAGLEVEDYLPSFFLVNIIRHIFASQGWKAIGEPLDDPFFAELALPYVGDGFQWNWATLAALSVSAPLVNNANNPIPRAFYQEENEETGLPHEDYFVPVSQPAQVNPANFYRPNVYNQIMAGQPAYQVRKTGTYMVSLSLTVDQFAVLNNDASPTTVHLQILRQTSPNIKASEVVRSVDFNQGDAVEIFGPVICNAGDYLVPVVRVVRDSNTANAAPLDFNYSFSDFVFTVAPDLELGPVDVDIAANLPEANQRDFVKAFISAGNLRFRTDYARKLIVFYYEDGYYLPAEFALDLAPYADPEKGQYVPASPAKRFLFNYTEEAEGYAPKGFHDVALDSGNANAQGDQTVALPFAATRMREYQTAYQNLTNSSPVLPCIASAKELEVTLNNVSWTHGFTMRWVRNEGPSVSGIWMAFINDLPSLSPYGMSTTTGLSWQELYDRHYAGYVGQISKGHILKNTFAINPDIYAQLHPARPVLFGGILHRLNKVQGFAIADPSAKAEIELFPLVPEAFGGGKPAQVVTGEGIEYYGQEYYSGEYY